MSDKPLAFRRIFEGTISYITLKGAWALLVPIPILVLSSPIWWDILPLSLRNEPDIDPSTTSIYWLVGIAGISIAVGFFSRWLAFGILSDNRIRMIIFASLVAVLGIFNAGITIVQIYILYFDPRLFMPHYAVKHGVSATFEFLALVGLLWLLFSKKKN